MARRTRALISYLPLSTKSKDNWCTYSGKFLTSSRKSLYSPHASHDSRARDRDDLFHRHLATFQLLPISIFQLKDAWQDHVHAPVNASRHGAFYFA